MTSTPEHPTQRSAGDFVPTEELARRQGIKPITSATYRSRSTSLRPWSSSPGASIWPEPRPYARRSDRPDRVIRDPARRRRRPALRRSRPCPARSSTYKDTWDIPGGYVEHVRAAGSTPAVSYLEHGRPPTPVWTT